MKMKYPSNDSRVKVQYIECYTRNITFGCGEVGFGDAKSIKPSSQSLHPP